MKLLGNINTERFKRLGKEGAWILLGQAANVLGLLVGVRIITTFLNPLVYGELALGMTFATLINQTLLGPLSNGITRFYAPASEKNELGSYLFAVRTLVIYASSLVIMILPVFVVGLIIWGKIEWVTLAIASLLFSIFNGSNSILNGIQNAARQRSIVALHQGLEPWARFIVAVSLFMLIKATSTVAMFGYVIGAILILISQFRFFKKISANLSSDSNRKMWQKKIYKYAWPFVTWGIFSWAQQVSDRWALSFFRSTEEVGLYAVLFQIGYTPMIVLSGLSVKFLAPILFQRAGDATNRTRNADVTKLSWSMTKYTILVTFVVFIVAFFFHQQIFELLVDSNFYIISYLLPWMLLSGGIFAASETISLNLLSQMKSNSLISVKIGTSILGIVSNLIGAYYFGINGIIVASLFFTITYLIWIILISKNSIIS